MPQHYTLTEAEAAALRDMISQIRNSRSKDRP